MKETERQDVMRAKELIDKIKILYDIFNSPSIIHLKFMKIHMYVIKRLEHLAF